MKISFVPKNIMYTILPLLSELDPSISRDSMTKRLDDMINNGYECVGIYSENILIGICGIWTHYKYYVGKHIEPDNVYIKAEYQNLGAGKLLVNWLVDLAKARGCEAIELNCYQGNKRGNEFWLKNNFKKIASHYQLKCK